MTSTIEALWSKLAEGSTRPAHLASSADGQIDLFAQLDAKARPGLLALSDAMPAKPPTYSAFEITIGKRSDKRWATSLSLSQESLRPQFASMCDRLLQQGASNGPHADASVFMLQQVARWHRMLALGADGLLSAEKQQGLLGELVVLDGALDKFGADAAVAGWVGPDDAPQDFLLPACPVEVKTILAGGQLVTISSLEQLDIADAALSLAVVEIVQCARGTGGTSLAGCVSRLRVRLEDNVHALSRFEDQLLKTGFTDRDEYGEVEFRVIRTRWFGVSGGFPRLVRSAVPLPVAAARYQLLLSAIATHETTPFNDHG